MTASQHCFSSGPVSSLSAIIIIFSRAFFRVAMGLLAVALTSGLDVQTTSSIFFDFPARA